MSFTSRRILRPLVLTASCLLVTPTMAGEGECASGFCGTPNDNGGGPCIDGVCSGGGGGGGGGSTLVANTDLGETYSTSDDYDADGYEDDHDNCSFLANRDQADGDGDGLGDGCDNAPGVNNPDQSDVDGDGLGDGLDNDDDNDDRLDGIDNCPLIPNLGQGDGDGDGIGDVCDADKDGDGVSDREDNCPLLANATQLMPGDRSLCGLTLDLDQDAMVDVFDNCPTAGNPAQGDVDDDGLGDACDGDADGDLVLGGLDNCALVDNPDQADADRDGRGDACDTHFCFVPASRTEAECLDPRSFFAVAATPAVVARTGEVVRLNLYANRENVGIRYSWSVVAAPEGSSAMVRHPVGAVSRSEAWQYRYQGERPAFVPDVAGVYDIQLAAELIDTDGLFAVRHAVNTVTLRVEGESMESGGCSAATGRIGRNAGASALAALAVMLLALHGRRRRAS